MGHAAYCPCKCLSENNTEIDAAAKVQSYPSTTSYVRRNSGDTTPEKGLPSWTPDFCRTGDPGDPPSKSPGFSDQSAIQTRSELDFAECEGTSEAGSSSGRLTPKCVTPNGRSPDTSGRVSPVPKLVLPTRVFHDSSQLGQARSGMTTKEWEKNQAQFSHLPPLPPDWIRVLSRSSGKMYYCHLPTGQTTFMKPEESGGQAASNPQVGSNENLPPGWCRMVSRTTGKPYYWNSVTHESQFEPPLSSPDATDTTLPDLPPGWVKHISRTTGRAYYFNRELQISQFQYPTADQIGQVPDTAAAR